MSYTVQTELESDAVFAGRIRAVISEQSLVFINDQRPDFQALAMSLLRLEQITNTSFGRMLVATPGFADTATDVDGTVDQSRIPDAALLSATQADFPTVVALFFDTDGNRLPGTGGPT